MNPKTEALAFRIWQHCEPLAWNLTIGECAEALGETPMRVGKVAKRKDWTTRFRAGRHRDDPWRRLTDYSTALTVTAHAPRTINSFEEANALF